MLLLNEAAVWGPLGANIRAILVEGCAHEAIQTVCRCLSFPIWCPVPDGDLVPNTSWIDLFPISPLASGISLRSSLPGNLPGGTQRGWQDVLLFYLFYSQ